MDRRVLVWDGGHDYVNCKAALSAVGLEAVVSADREEAARCAALLLTVCRRKRSGSSRHSPRRRSRFWVYAGACRR